MLKNTFCHLPGVGAASESRLWDAGLLSWDAVVGDAAAVLPAKQREKLRGNIRDCEKHLADGNPGYFGELLPSKQAWRIFPEFRDSTAYLDIETTGLGGYGDHITTIALYDGRSIYHYVHGRNLDEFQDKIAEYKVIVTYNGKTFDVPFIRAALGVPMPHAHIDLRYILGSLGFKGGLKGCERQIGVDRKELADVDGYFAVLLWHEFKRHGDERALETLLAYNIADVVNLETLMTLAYNMKIRDTPFAGTHALPHPAPPEIPFKADMPTIDRIRRANWL